MFILYVTRDYSASLFEKWIMEKNKNKKIIKARNILCLVQETILFHFFLSVK